MHQYVLLHGIGGIGIVRISGDKSFEIIKKVFYPKNTNSMENIKGYTMKYGFIKDKNEIIDEVIVSFFKAPKSYTTENMCEINSHGGNIIIHKILNLCLKNGAELAEPGEFTKRAFLNGRIDLIQAESVIDIINAKSFNESKVGMNQLEGVLSTKINNIKKELMDIITNIDVSIDYPEYDTPSLGKEELIQKIEKIENQFNKLINSFEDGKIIKEGIKTAIIGKPNSGKSSLLNTILNEERAIVTEYEGTTRDLIEEFINIRGIPIKIVDTAGIRETEDKIEKIGIEKSKKIAKDADLVICIIDSSSILTSLDKYILNNLDCKNTIIVLNKIDLDNKINEKDNSICKFNNIVKISALKKIGIEELYDKIEEMFNFNHINFSADTIITNVRQKNLIIKALDNLKQAKEKIIQNVPIDIVAININSTLKDLLEITGEDVNEEIIDEIFSRFCLGK